VTAKVGLRAAAADDYAFALAIYVETIKPYTVACMEWIDAEQTARFARLWMPAEVRVITAHGADVGWLQASETGPEIFLKQMYVAPAHQRRGIGSEILRRLLDRWEITKKPVCSACSGTIRRAGCTNASDLSSPARPTRNS